MNASLKKVIAEFIGTFTFLLAIAGASSSGSPLKQVSLALTLGLMILTLGGISGGHFNPAVSIYFFAKKQLSFGALVSYVVAQLAGAYVGVVAGLGLWDKTVSPLAEGNQVSAPIFLGEVLATAGLVFIIGTLVNNKQANLIWIAVATWVFAAGTFTVTGAMANPAVAFGLMFNGISTGSIASIVVAQLAGLVVTILLLLITGASTKKKAPKQETPKFVPAPIVAAPAAATPAATTAAKKPAAKKPVAKKAAASKTVAKPVAKKAAAKKPAAKKAPAKK
jgi:glycerol uptake facilitator-like aquaporin